MTGKTPEKVSDKIILDDDFNLASSIHGDGQTFASRQET